MINENMCPVCGYVMEAPPRDYNICSCCGTEFGHHDLNSTIKDLRAEWLRHGAVWWSPTVASPAGWDPYEQLNALIDRQLSHTAEPPVSSGLRASIVGSDYSQGAIGRHPLGITVHTSNMAA